MFFTNILVRRVPTVRARLTCLLAIASKHWVKGVTFPGKEFEQKGVKIP